MYMYMYMLYVYVCIYNMLYNFLQRCARTTPPELNPDASSLSASCEPSAQLWLEPRGPGVAAMSRQSSKEQQRELPIHPLIIRNIYIYIYIYT